MAQKNVKSAWNRLTWVGAYILRQQVHWGYVEKTAENTGTEVEKSRACGREGCGGVWKRDVRKIGA